MDRINKKDTTKKGRLKKSTAKGGKVKSVKKTKPSKKYRSPLLYEIFKEFRFLSAKYLYSKKIIDPNFKEELIKRDINIESDQLAIIKFCLTNDEDLKAAFINLGTDYFNKTNSYYVTNNYEPKEFDYKVILGIFCILFDYKKESLDRNRFLQHLIKKIDIELNCDRFKRLEQIRILQKFIERKPESNIAKTLVKTSIYNRFKNTKWFLYFYGYTKVGHSTDPNFWKLVRLTLEFDKTLSGGNLGIIIDNTADEDHRNYLGKTNFQNSTDKVLVMNFRTEEKERDLNIKFNVSNLEGNIFEGQYLNYEPKPGRIISGTILMVNYVEKNEGFYPTTFPVALDSSNISKYPEIQEIIHFFQGNNLVFRETL
jgi:hypothetical protein